MRPELVLEPPGQGGSAHTHEVEEAFFVLEGELTVFFQDKMLFLLF